MGKAAVLLVVGFGIFFMISGVNLSSVSVQAYDNAMDYYEGGTARNIAIAGANLGANKLFLSPPNVNGNPFMARRTHRGSCASPAVHGLEAK
jgi:hypothetical protein